MSQQNRKLKELRRRDRKDRRERTAMPRRLTASGLPPTLDLAGPDGKTSTLHLVEYKINFDAMKHGPPEPMCDHLDEDARRALFYDVHHNPAAAILRLRELVEQFPESRTALNWLSSALAANAQTAEAFVVSRELFARFPDYFFARCNLAQMYLFQGDVAAAEQLLAGFSCIKDLYPDRDEFHVTEVSSFESTMIQLLCAKGDIEAAANRLAMLRDILDEETPMFRQACAQVRAASLKQAMTSGLVSRTIGSLRSALERRARPTHQSINNV